MSERLGPKLFFLAAGQLLITKLQDVALRYIEEQRSLQSQTVADSPLEPLLQFDPSVLAAHLAFRDFEQFKR